MCELQLPTALYPIQEQVLPAPRRHLPCPVGLWHPCSGMWLAGAPCAVCSLDLWPSTRGQQHQLQHVTRPPALLSRVAIATLTIVGRFLEGRSTWLDLKIRDVLVNFQAKSEARLRRATRLSRALVFPASLLIPRSRCFNRCRCCSGPVYLPYINGSRFDA